MPLSGGFQWASVLEEAGFLSHSGIVMPSLHAYNDMAAVAAAILETQGSAL